MATIDRLPLGDRQPPDDEDRLKPRDRRQWYDYWDREIQSAEKRCQKFITRGVKAVDRYLDQRDAAVGTRDDNWRTFRLNLFHANVTTLKAMLCGSLPTVEVKREFADPDDDTARVAAVLLQRLLQQDIEASPDNFTETLKACLEDRLVPGIGTARVRYTHSQQTVASGQILPFEEAPLEYVHWKDFRWSYARVWNEVWWQGFRSYLTREQIIQRFGEGADTNLQFSYQGPKGNDAEVPDDREKTDSEAKTEVWEIWSKTHKRVFWFSSGNQRILDIKEDPLKLNNFFPAPKPMFANIATSEVMPTADFTISKDLYDEIDQLQTRIGIITQAVKVVGVYDATATGLQRMLTEGIENDMIPVDSWAVFGERGGLKGSVDWFPVADVAAVLNQLIEVRDQTIQLLYEVTGMSDILRGKTDQYTGVGQDAIKEKYASIRIQNAQDDFARFASDLQTLKAEVISKFYQPQTIGQRSNARFLPRADHDKIIPAIQLIQSPQIFWRVEIRPESIAMVDYAQMQSERTAYLNGVATYIQSAQALIKQIPQSAPMLVAMMKWGLAGFRGSKEIEGVLDQVLDSAQQAVQSGQLGGQDDGKAQADAAKIKAEMQRDAQKHQQAMQLEQMKASNTMRLEMTEAQNNFRLEMMTHQSDVKRDMAKLQGDLRKIAAKLGADLQVEEAQSGFAMLERDTEFNHDVTREVLDHENAMELEEEQHENTMEQLRANRNAGSSDN